MTNRLPATEHTARPWQIHQLAPDFRVQDVWAFRAPGAGPDDFPTMLDALHGAGGLENNPPLVRLLFAVRWKLGALLGWDTDKKGFDGRVDSLCDRLPKDLRQHDSGTAVPGIPFTKVFQLPNEAAMELANETVHGVCHFGWVPVDGEAGEHPGGGSGSEDELRMAVLVKPNGLLGELYLAGIIPFRYLFVYPEMTRRIERAWRDRALRDESPDGRSATCGSQARD